MLVIFNFKLNDTKRVSTPKIKTKLSVNNDFLASAKTVLSRTMKLHIKTLSCPTKISEIMFLKKYFQVVWTTISTKKRLVRGKILFTTSVQSKPFNVFLAKYLLCFSTKTSGWAYLSAILTGNLFCKYSNVLWFNECIVLSFGWITNYATRLMTALPNLLCLMMISFELFYWN